MGNNILKIMFIFGCDSYRNLYRNKIKILSCLRKVEILARCRSAFFGVLLGGCIIVFFRKPEIFLELTSEFVWPRPVSGSCHSL